jgi:aminoglycoside phosphotransferase (APT) family kinase protein
MEAFDSPSARERLAQRFAQELGPGCTAVRLIEAKRMSNGHSNDTYFARLAWQEGGADREASYVLRSRPEGVGLLEPYDVGKQYRIMQALHGCVVPVPRMNWFDEAGEIIGRPLFAMEMLEGVIIEQEVPPYVAQAEAAKVRRMCERYVETVAAIHRLDWRAQGLGFLPSDPDFLGHEINWWTEEVRKVQRGPLPALEAISAWLTANRPQEPRVTTLVHGDAKLGNVLFDDETVVAMLDWEMTTVGDPLTDVGWMLWLWNPEGVGLPALPGALSKAELVALYEKLSGIQVDHQEFYEVLAGFKMAAILLVGAELFESGVSNDLRYVAFGQTIPLLMTRMLETAGLNPSIPVGSTVPSWPRICEGIGHAVVDTVLPELTSLVGRTQALSIPRIVGLFALGQVPTPPLAAPASAEEETARALSPR